MNLVYVPLNDAIKMVDTDDNPRNGDVESLAEIINEYGFQDPPRLGSDGKFMHGNHRVMAIGYLSERGGPAPLNIRIEQGQWQIPVLCEGEAYDSKLLAYKVEHNNAILPKGRDTAFLHKDNYGEFLLRAASNGKLHTVSESEMNKLFSKVAINIQADTENAMADIPDTSDVQIGSDAFVTSEFEKATIGYTPDVVWVNAYNSSILETAMSYMDGVRGLNAFVVLPPNPVASLALIGDRMPVLEVFNLYGRKDTVKDFRLVLWVSRGQSRAIKGKSVRDNKADTTLFFNAVSPSAIKAICGDYLLGNAMVIGGNILSTVNVFPSCRVYEPDDNLIRLGLNNLSKNEYLEVREWST